MPRPVVGCPRGRADDSLAIDGHVRGLNAREAAARLTFGRLAHELCGSRAYHALGFARLGDYTRERLGLSPREVESLAQVTTALAGLPAVAAVFARGELSWTRARLLAGVATADDEMIWLSRARGCSAASASIVMLLRTALGAFAAAPREPRWRSCERMLRHVQATWRALPRHPDPIFERDGWRCAVPACSGRRNLHDHHVRFRSRGGDNRRTNRITVCAWHHLRAIHCGRVRGWGTAPHGIRWQLGLDTSGAPPLLELLADRYLDDAEVMADRLVHKRHMAARLAAWIPLDGDWDQTKA